MFHDDVIVTHLIMENMHKKQCPYIRGRGSAMPGSHKSQPNVQYIYDTYTIKGQNVIPQNISCKPNTYQLKPMELLDLNAIILNNL